MTALSQSRHNDQQRRDMRSQVRFVVRLAQQVPFDDRQSDVRERVSRLLSSTP
jgi:hypothetical protein